jgi:uncharacterized protein
LARILLFLAIGVVLWLLYKGFLRKQARPDGKPQEGGAEDMVACARCGVNMPRSEAREEGGKYYCRDNAACKHNG